MEAASGEAASGEGAFGRPVRRKEDGRLLTGAGRYVSDVELPRMLHVAFVRSAHAHARIRAIDARAAAALPGVVAIVAGDDPDVSRHRLRARSALPGYVETEQPLLAWPRVRYCGEALAAVVAGDRYVAEDAAERVEVDAEPLPVRGGRRPAAGARGLGRRDAACRWSTTRRPATRCSRGASRAGTSRRRSRRGRRRRARVPHQPADRGADGGPRRRRRVGRRRRQAHPLVRHAGAAPRAPRPRRDPRPAREPRARDRPRRRRRLRLQGRRSIRRTCCSACSPAGSAGR